jgi:hypothetical protein
VGDTKACHRPRFDHPEGRASVEGVIRYTDPAGMRYRIDTAEPASSSQVIITEGRHLCLGRSDRDTRPAVDPHRRRGTRPARLVAPARRGRRHGNGALGRSASFTDSGSSTVPGTRQYTAQLSRDEWLAAQDESQREELREWADREQVSGATIMLFLDEGNLPVKQIVMLGWYTLEAVFSDWGTPVSITRPPKRRTARCEAVAACEDMLNAPGDDGRSETV